jgi:hypothetical protein
MFAVSKYDHPTIYVRCCRTGETYKFLVESDGILSHREARFDQGSARRTAIAFLAKHSFAGDMTAVDGVAAFALVL